MRCGGGGGCGGLVWDGRRVLLKYSREVGWGGGQGELGKVEDNDYRKIEL